LSFVENMYKDQRPIISVKTDVLKTAYIVKIASDCSTSHNKQK